jgi:hypothetical protein
VIYDNGHGNVCSDVYTIQFAKGKPQRMVKVFAMGFILVLEIRVVVPSCTELMWQQAALNV